MFGEGLTAVARRATAERGRAVVTFSTALVTAALATLAAEARTCMCGCCRIGSVLCVRGRRERYREREREFQG